MLALKYKDSKDVRVVKPPPGPYKTELRRRKQREYNHTFIAVHGQTHMLKYRPLIENYTFSASCLICQREFMGDGKNRGQITSTIHRHCNACTIDRAVIRDRISKRSTISVKKLRAERKLFLHNWKEQQGCYVCGERCFAIIDPHHLNPDEKEGRVSQLMMCSMERLLKELLKCVCLCRNCHGKVHSDLLSLLLNYHNENKPFDLVHGLEAG